MGYYDNSRWHHAVTITHCSRGAYLVDVDVGDAGIGPEMVHVAASSQPAARRLARKTAHGPVHYVQQDDRWFGYVLATHYGYWQLELLRQLEGAEV